MTLAAVAMWFFVLVCAGLGALGLLSPGAMRRVIGTFLKDTPVRIFGVLLMIGGALLFAFAGGTKLPVFVQAMAVFLFIAGGVQILIPTFAVLVNEWWLEKTALWIRFSGLVYLGVACAFFYAAKDIKSLPAAPPTEIVAPAQESAK